MRAVAVSAGMGDYRRCRGFGRVRVSNCRRSATRSWVMAAICLGLMALAMPAAAEEENESGGVRPEALGLALPLAAELSRSLGALEALIEADLPFMIDQRQARVAELRERLNARPLEAADQVERLVAAWRQELAYGREIDGWRGLLVGDDSREVDYLRLGRVGLYFLTPDGREGGVWSRDERRWQALEGAALAELRKGVAIARERRAPGLLALPLSIGPETPWMDRGGSLPAWQEVARVPEDESLLALASRQVSELRDGLNDSRLELGSELALPARPEEGASGAAAVTDLLRHLEAWSRESGHWRRFEAPVTGVDGRIAPREVARVGDLLLFGGGDLLRPGGEPSDRRLAVVEGLDREQRTRLSDAWDGGEAMLIDPTGGQLLEALARQPSLAERFHQGGVVGYVVVALGALGLLVALLQFLYLAAVRWRLRRQLRDLDRLRDDNPLGRVLGRFRTLRQGLPPEALEARLDEALLAELPRLERGQGLVKLLAAVSPLLGLLGTVTGMIVTFQAITVFGTGDPQLMAGGISQALVTTVLGLIAAVPLLFAHTALTSSSRGLVAVLEGNASAALAEHLEAQPQAAADLASGSREARLAHA